MLQSKLFPSNFAKEDPKDEQAQSALRTCRVYRKIRCGYLYHAAAWLAGVKPRGNNYSRRNGKIDAQSFYACHAPQRGGLQLGVGKRQKR